LVTVVGPGGMGKTRLALEAAHRSNNLFQSIYFVPLASLNTPDLLVSAIADVLQFSTMNQDDFLAQLVNYLSDKKLLLILDNMDHLVAGAMLLSQIVARAPDVKLVVTSRERLNLHGEWVLDLKGLSIDGENQGAVQLFVQRAQMVQSDFVFSDAISSPITRICQLVDGMPLGIELAAAWVHMLSCQEIADSIASNLAFLTAKSRDLPERHQSLRAVFEHSWELLSAEEQHVFRALAVFRGGFQTDAALEVCGATLPQLLTFVNKSMLHRNAQGRYEIHELLRQYALEKLRESGDAQTAYSRHLQLYAELVETAERQIQGGQQIPWMERLDAENDNLRTALDWSLKNRATETGLRLAGSLWFLWHVHNYAREGLSWLEKLLAAAPEAPADLRTKALFAAGWLAQNNRDLPRAATLSESSLQLARQIGDKRSIAYPLSTLAWLAYFQGNYPQAAALGEESLSLFREVNDLWGTVHTLNILGYIAESEADYLRAELLQREGMIIARTAGDSDSLAWSIYLLGRIMAERGQYAQAIQLCNESLDIYRELGNTWAIALVLYTLGDSSLALGELSSAASLCQESVKLLREVSDFWAIGGPLSSLGLVAYRQGDLVQASALSQESLLYFRQFGDKRGMAYALDTLGYIANRQGQLDHARDLFRDSLRLRRDVGIRHGMEVCFMQLAEIAALLGEATRAAQLFGAGEALRQTLGVSMAEADIEQYESSIALLRKQLNDSAFQSAWAEGQTLPLDTMIAIALEK
jgi:predicted ATPase